MTLALALAWALKSIDQPFCIMSFDVGLSDVFLCPIWVMHFWEDCCRSNGMSSSMSYRTAVMSLCPVTSNVNSDHFVKLVSTSPVQWKFIYFAFCKWWVIWGKILWDYVNILNLLKLLPTSSSICWWVLPESVIAIKNRAGFSNSIILSTFIRISRL